MTLGDIVLIKINFWTTVPASRDFYSMQKYDGPGGSQSSFNFSQSSFNFHSPGLIFHSLVLIFHSPVLIFHSPVLRFQFTPNDNLA